MKKLNMTKKKNFKNRYKLIGINLLCGCILISTGFILELKAVVSNVLLSNNLNLNISEVNTDYQEETKSQEENNQPNSSDVAYQVDTSWAWPATTNYYISTPYSSQHNGIDIVPKVGDYNIHAASSGVIVTNGWRWDNGNYLVLKQDNGYYTMYAHLSQKIANEGQRVEKGQVIGIMGRTGRATGVHLHYSTWRGYPYSRGSSTVNPFSFY